VFNKTTADKLY
jgi:hypothetical protein